MNKSLLKKNNLNRCNGCGRLLKWSSVKDARIEKRARYCYDGDGFPVKNYIHIACKDCKEWFGPIRGYSLVEG